jgi:preprotein translocase subunit SecE
MAKSKATPPANRLRTATVAPASGAVAARAEAHVPKKRTNPVQFFREVRAEAKKITWPSRRETWITTVMVLIMVVITSIFFLVVDASLSLGVSQLLKLGAPAS